jgi:hypothetical protein
MGKLAKFKSRIRRAFSDAVYPGDDKIIKNSTHYEIEDLHQDFDGKRWQEISLAIAEPWHNGTMLFTPEGFRYYLPAFLLADLHENSVQIGSYLIYSFEPPVEPEALAQFLETMNSFTDAQKSVIAEWIKRFFERNPIYDQHHGEVTKAFWNITD